MTAVISKDRSTMLMTSGSGLQTPQFSESETAKFPLCSQLRNSPCWSQVGPRERARLSTLLWLPEKQSLSRCPITSVSESLASYYIPRRAFTLGRETNNMGLHLRILSDAKLLECVIQPPEPMKKTYSSVSPLKDLVLPSRQRAPCEVNLIKLVIYTGQ